MPRICILIGASWVALALAAQFAVGASALLRSSVPCRPGQAKLIAADTQAVVYLGRVTERSSPFHTMTYLGCVRGNRHAYGVGGPGGGSSSGGGGTRRLTISGPIVAWEEWEHINTVEPGKNEWMVLVRDLRTGRVLHELPTGMATVRGWTGVGPTTEIVVNAAGSVAWIAAMEGEHGPDGYEVHVADRAGARLLATGLNIAPGSLALAGSTLYWMQGGVAMSASVH